MEEVDADIFDREAEEHFGTGWTERKVDRTLPISEQLYEVYRNPNARGPGDFEGKLHMLHGWAENARRPEVPARQWI
jgi:hypothetical protein